MSIHVYPETQVGVTFNPDWVTYADMGYTNVTFRGYTDYAVTTSFADLFHNATFASETITTSSSNGITYTASNGRFTIANAGTYFFRVQLCLVRIAGSNEVVVEVQKNGTTTNYAGFNDPGPFTLEGLVDCAASDYLEFFVAAETNSEWELRQGHSVYIKRELGT